MNIVESDLGLEFINKLLPVSYNWKNGDTQKHYGLISQDIETLVGNNFGGFVPAKNSEEYQGLRYTEFISPMIKAIKDLSKKCIELENKLEDLTKID